MLRNFFKTAWRNLAKNKIFTAINILGLSLGITACLVIYLITSFELSYDKFHPDKDRIYRIVTKQQDEQGKRNEIGATLNPLPATMRDELTGFENVTIFHTYFANVSVPDGKKEPKKFDAAKRSEEPSPIIICEPQYFSIFKYQWLQGNPTTALKEPFKVVLSENEAHRYFSNQKLENIIGKDIFYKDIYFADSLHLTVSGIVKDWDKNTDFTFRDFISYPTIEHSFIKNEIDLHNWGNWNPEAQGFVKLAKGVTPAQVERQFPKFAKDHIAPYPGHTNTLLLQPLSDIHFNSLYHDTYSRKAHLPTLYGLMGIAVFILIIAAINFINLSTAQSLYRSKEIGVRKVLGSSRASLRLQFLLETFMVTFISVIISIGIAYPIINMFRLMIPHGVNMNIFNLSTIIFLVLITIITSLLAGFYPAKVLSEYLPVLSLKGISAEKKAGGNYLRKSLIVFQFTVSLVFIICTLIIGNQIHYIMNKDLGFKKDAIITFYTGWNNPVNQTSLFATKIREIPAVQSVSIHLETPAAKSHSQTHIDAGEFTTPASYEMCDENYVPLYGLSIIAGRNISHSDTVREFLINETCVKALGFKKPEDAIGKMISEGMNEGRGYIVGVIKDFHSRSLHEPVTPFFISSDKGHERAISIKLSTTDKQISDFNFTIAKIEKIWKGFFPNERFEYRFFDETIARLYDQEHKTAQLMNTAMTIAIFISCMGLFGLATFTAHQRTKEIGIRKVLGASVTGIIGMISMDFIKLVFLAIVLASPVAYYFMHEWLQDFAYRVHISWVTFIIAGTTAILIALLTISFQTIRAAVANPVKSLRSE